jgi:hypothetical protein
VLIVLERVALGKFVDSAKVPAVLLQLVDVQPLKPTTLKLSEKIVVALTALKAKTNAKIPTINNPSLLVFIFLCHFGVTSGL